MTESDRIIDALGGTGEVARLCQVGDSAVSQWRRNGIPKPRLMYLQAVRRRAFAKLAESAQNETAAQS